MSNSISNFTFSYLLVLPPALTANFPPWCTVHNLPALLAFAHSDKPKRRWFSVGKTDSISGQWHQVTGFSDATKIKGSVTGQGLVTSFYSHVFVLSKEDYVPP